MTLGIGAAIVTYEPTEALTDLVGKLLSAQIAVHIVDNASTTGVDHVAAAESAGATVTRLPTNTGVAGALHVALEAATEPWLLTLDQDSHLPAGMLSMVRRSTALLEPRVSIVAPVIRDEETGAVLQGDPGHGGWYEVDRVLTSGALCRVAALREVGGFRADLVIDFVDWDLCLRLRAAGWRIAVDPSVLLLHSIGASTQHRVPVVGEVTTTNHSPDRQYYKYRNFLLLARDGSLGSAPGWAARTALGLVFGVGKILTFESDKARKVAAVAAGVRDGMLGRAGVRPGTTRREPRRTSSEESSGATSPSRLLRRTPVSVCMATYNGAEFVRTQLDSILAQLGPDDEVLVQDDGSSDDTTAIVESYGDPRIVIERNALNAGVIATFERCLARATRPIVFLSDQDDEWLPGKVEAMVACFENPAVTAVVTNATIVDEAGAEVGDYFSHARSGPGVVHNFVKNSYLGCCMAVRREVLDLALPVPREVRTHDGWIGIAADLMGDVVFLPTPYVRYNRHGGNLSQMHRFGLFDIARRRAYLAANLVRIGPRAVRHSRRVQPTDS